MRQPLNTSYIALCLRLSSNASSCVPSNVCVSILSLIILKTVKNTCYFLWINLFTNILDDQIYHFILFIFVVGPLDPGKSGFVGQSTIVVCTQGAGHQLLLEPRDEYGNLCTYAPENDHRNNYQIQITEVSIYTPFSFSWCTNLPISNFIL